MSCTFAALLANNEVFMRIIFLISGFVVGETLVNNQERPNIVFIMADDLGWDDVGFHGSQEIPTPNLDALAYSGLILKNYYVCPICSPSRSALMTGKHPIHTGLQHGTINGAQPYGLSLNETLLSQHLKRLGYATHIVGKWHLGFFAKEYTPLYRGFDSHFGYYNGMEDYLDHTYYENHKYWGYDLRHNMNLINMSNQYSTEFYTKQAESIIHSHDKKQPLFLYFAHQAVHSSNFYRPLYAPERYVKRVSHIHHKGRQMYAAMVNALDESVGNLTKALHKNNMLQNTIIVFSTDNGGPAAGFDLNYASNWPLRGVKNTLWEGAVRGTGFLWSPTMPRRTSGVSSQLVHITDWLPTLYQAAGGSVKILDGIDGFDLWDDLINDRPSKRKDVLHNIDPIENVSAIQVGDWKVIQGERFRGKYDGWFKPESINYQTVVLSENDIINGIHSSTTGQILMEIGLKNFKIISPLFVDCGHKVINSSCNLADKPCLFNITLDPCEYHNLADEFPEKVEQLLDILETYRSTSVKPRNKPNDPKGDPKLHQRAWIPWISLE